MIKNQKCAEYVKSKAKNHPYRKAEIAASKASSCERNVWKKVNPESDIVSQQTKPSARAIVIDPEYPEYPDSV